MEDLFVQRITLERNGSRVGDLDLSLLDEINVVETMDLSGPRIMLAMRDPHRVIRDNSGAKKSDVLEVYLSDRFGGDGIDNVIRFRVVTHPSAKEIVEFSGFEENVYDMKNPVSKPVLYQRLPVKTIVSKLAPNVGAYAVGKFPETTCHVLPGARVSKALRMMAREVGAACFIQRGRLVFWSLQELFAADPSFIYEHNNPRSKYVIPSFALPGSDALVEDRINRRYVGWNMKDGLIEGGLGDKGMVEFSGLQTKATLDALHKIPVPAIDYQCPGNGGVMPGIVIGIRANLPRKDSPLDESAPSRVLVSTVAHNYRAQKYIMRVKGAIIR